MFYVIEFLERMHGPHKTIASDINTAKMLLIILQNSDAVIAMRLQEMELREIGMSEASLPKYRPDGFTKEDYDRTH